MHAMRTLVLVLAAAAGLAARHECERTCEVGDVRTCKYEFHVQEYYTMGRACFECATNPSDCEREECIAADGVPRPLLAVNRQLPGPAIQVCEGDRVVVDVYNHMLSDTETIHWHGQHMRQHQYYDGVPFVTQCPITAAPFRYNFIADTPGTAWWHSHSGLHRMEGVYGAFVVRQAEDVLHGAYEVDDFDHVVIVSDWIHTTAFDQFTARYHYTGDDQARTLLVNGRGRNTNAKVEGVEMVQTPLAEVRVTPGLKHRVRLISAVSLNCPVVVTVDQHTMTLVATDGAEVVPYAADTIVMYSGERFDVIIEADQPVDNYWIRFNGLINCASFESVQGAVLRYEGAPEEEPETPLTFDPSYAPGPVINPLNSVGGPDDVGMVELESFLPTSVSEHVDKKFYVGFDMVRTNHSSFFNPDLYPYNGVSSKWQVNIPQILHMNVKLPDAPPLSQPDAAVPSLCMYGEDFSRFCEAGWCSCSLVMEVALGDEVEMILVDQGHIYDVNHPFHLHGYKFAVVAMGKLGRETSIWDVAALDNAGGIERKLDNAVLKDSVNIPDGGYTIIRFTADNPGWWFMHCHIAFHADLGMGALLHVGTPDDLPPVPPGFPTCGPFMPE